MAEGNGASREKLLNRCRKHTARSIADRARSKARAFDLFSIQGIMAPTFTR
jgi:hypothetical protein